MNTSDMVSETEQFNEKQTMVDFFPKYRHHVVIKIILWLIFVMGLLVFYALKWSIDEYGVVPFGQVVFHLKVPLAGTSNDLVSDFVLGFIEMAWLPIMLWTVILVCGPYIIYCTRMMRRLRQWNLEDSAKKSLYKSYKLADILELVIAVICACTLLGCGVYQAFTTLGIPKYIDDMTHPTTLYEDYYVAADSVEIQFPEKKKNLIYIFMESMENSYTDATYGGKMQENLIPELTTLALENERFASGNNIGGAISTMNTTWTVGAMVAQTSGLPLSIPINVNGYGKYASFLPGATTLGDILSEEGYQQELLIGSNASFGGRRQYFSQHGNYTIFDLNYALEEKLVPESNGFWGFEDSQLFEFAKQEATRMAESGEPFNLTMLTVDTHFPSGWTCQYCDNQYSTSMENAIACSSKQVDAFVNWLQQQDFYEDTVVIISGDHPNMGTVIKNLINDEDYLRLTYFTILNSDAKREDSADRVFSTMDIFPTTLAAMGCSIEGDRLGLGTNLYSAKKTLVEEMGLEALNDELGKISLFYDDHIIAEQ